MISFEKEELLKTARLSGFTLDEDEIAIFEKHLTKVINYTSEMSEVSTEEVFTTNVKKNVSREDKALPCDSKELIKQAPESDDNYFVVPKIL